MVMSERKENIKKVGLITGASLGTLCLLGFAIQRGSIDTTEVMMKLDRDGYIFHNKSGSLAGYVGVEFKPTSMPPLDTVVNPFNCLDVDFGLGGSDAHPKLTLYDNDVDPDKIPIVCFYEHHSDLLDQLVQK
jgi:hypothetical protein